MWDLLLFQWDLLLKVVLLDLSLGLSQWLRHPVLFHILKLDITFLTKTFTFLLVMSVENMSAQDAITPPRMMNVEKEVKIITIFGFTIFQRKVNCKDKLQEC